MRMCSTPKSYVIEHLIGHKIVDKKTIKRRTEYFFRKFLSSANKNTLTVLSVGFGVPYELETLVTLGCKTFGLDSDKWAVNYANQQGFNVFQCDVNTQQFPFEGEMFDGIVASQIIEHLNNPMHFVKECWRVLRDDGILIIDTPDYEVWGHTFYTADKTHTTPFTKESLSKLLSPLFLIVELRNFAWIDIVWRFTDLGFDSYNPFNKFNIFKKRERLGILVVCKKIR